VLNKTRAGKKLSDCCLTPTRPMFSYIMAKTSYFSRRWWFNII